MSSCSRRKTWPVSVALRRSPARSITSVKAVSNAVRTRIMVHAALSAKQAKNRNYLSSSKYVARLVPDTNKTTRERPTMDAAELTKARPETTDPLLRYGRVLDISMALDASTFRMQVPDGFDKDCQFEVE